MVGNTKWGRAEGKTVNTKANMVKQGGTTSAKRKRLLLSKRDESRGS